MKQCEIITTTNWTLKTHKTILGHKNDRMALAKDVTRHGLHTMAHITAFKLWHIQRNSYYGPQQRFQKMAVMTEWISPNIAWPITRVSKYGSDHVLQNMTLMNTFANYGQNKTNISIRPKHTVCQPHPKKGVGGRGGSLEIRRPLPVAWAMRAK